VLRQFGTILDEYLVKKKVTINFESKGRGNTRSCVCYNILIAVIQEENALIKLKTAELSAVLVSQPVAADRGLAGNSHVKYPAVTVFRFAENMQEATHPNTQGGEDGSRCSVGYMRQNVRRYGFDSDRSVRDL